MTNIIASLKKVSVNKVNKIERLAPLRYVLVYLYPELLELAYGFGNYRSSKLTKQIDRQRRSSSSRLVFAFKRVFENIESSPPQIDRARKTRLIRSVRRTPARVETADDRRDSRGDTKPPQHGFSTFFFVFYPFNRTTILHCADYTGAAIVEIHSLYLNKCKIRTRQNCFSTRGRGEVDRRHRRNINKKEHRCTFIHKQ